ncbi:MAG: nucleotidyltransferase domain-containing protein [Deltaproteobacteria bacterium]|nr:nucleotidyltransferase domain-containing protein [Deltaproteobacteria bacterium]
MILEKCLANRSEVVAAYLFGSAAKGGSGARDLDILVLLRPDVDASRIYFELAASLSDTLGIQEDKIDLLFFNMDEADPMVLYEAVSTGILLKNIDPDMLGDSIDALSRYFLENDVIIERAAQLRNERLEDFCADRQKKADQISG